MIKFCAEINENSSFNVKSKKKKLLFQILLYDHYKKNVLLTGFEPETFRTLSNQLIKSVVDFILLLDFHILCEKESPIKVCNSQNSTFPLITSEHPNKKLN